MRKVLLLCLLLGLGTSSLYAQEAPATVTDEELLKYATAMDSVNELTVQLMDTITAMVKSNAAVSAARYNDLSKIITDETKLTEANATPEEIAFVKQVGERKAKGTAEINAALQSLAKEYVGASVFNKVKKSIAADPELKTKYNALMEELKKDNGVAK